MTTALDGIFDALAEIKCPFDGGRVDSTLTCVECRRQFRVTRKSVSWTSPGGSAGYAKPPKVPEQAAAQS